MLIIHTIRNNVTQMSIFINKVNKFTIGCAATGIEPAIKLSVITSLNLKIKRLHYGTSKVPQWLARKTQF